MDSRARPASYILYITRKPSMSDVHILHLKCKKSIVSIFLEFVSILGICVDFGVEILIELGMLGETTEKVGQV